MTDVLVIIALGFLLGMRHATDADHVVAVTAIVTRQQRVSSAAFTGLAWGLGHTMTIVIVGAAVILFQVVISDAASARMELAVGLMLIVLGAVNVAAFLREASAAGSAGRRPSAEGRLRRTNVRCLPAESRSDRRCYPLTSVSSASSAAPGPSAASAPSAASVPSAAGSAGWRPSAEGLLRRTGVHSLPAEPRSDRRRYPLTSESSESSAASVASASSVASAAPLSSAASVARPLIVGVVHGLAGSAAVALLVLATIRDTRWAIAYLAVFGLGTIAGMVLITTGLASAIHLVGRHARSLGRHLSLASGLASVAFGCWLAWETL